MAAFSVINALPFATSLILIVSSITLFLFYYMKKKFSYWKRRGVPYAEPTLFFGNIKDLALQRVPIAFVYQKMYKELDGHKFGGFYQFTKPALLLRDPELIKNFLVKSFSHFHDRNSPLDEKLEPLSFHLVNLTGQRWRNVRYKLTPTFSSGKLKLMQDSMQDCIRVLDVYLTDVTNGNSTCVLNMRELLSKFGTDVIGSCAFGLRCNAIQDDNSEFRRISQLIFKRNYLERLRNILRAFNPSLNKLLRIKRLTPEIEEFFRSMVRETFKYRDATVQKRNDFVQLMIDIQAEEKKHLQSNGNQQQNGAHVRDENVGKNPSESNSDILFTDNIVAASTFVFFTAGYETTTLTLSWCLYELAQNPDICEKVRGEVESVKRAHNGTLDYNTMKELGYLEAVISETLRKYPVATSLNRRCTESFQIPGTSVVIEKGTNVAVSLYGLHHDPQYFPEPEKFLPERFSESNKHSIIPGTYLPFGEGPRICIGMRFAMYEMKSVLSYLVSNFTFHPSEKTTAPLEFSCRSAFHSPTGGVWVGIRRRPAS